MPLPVGLTLTHLVSLPVRDREGSLLGRVLDVRVDPRRTPPVIDLVLVGERRREPVPVPWAQVDPAAGLVDELVVVGPPGEPVRPGPDTGAAAGSDLMLCRDVLDSQVIDLSGSRLSRVSDVLLSLDPDGRLTVVAVDLGMGALLARMGLGSIGRHLREVVVAWDDLYLGSAGGHRVELSVSAERLGRRDAGSVAEVVARLRTDQATDVLRAVDPARAASALAASHDLLRRRLVASLPAEDAAAVLGATSELESTPHPGGPGAPGGIGRRFLRTSGWRVRRPARSRP